MLVTEETSQAIEWLVVEGGGAAEHLRTCPSTEDTSQVFRGWLKAVAPVNISDMSVTEDTSQEEMSPLNLEAAIEQCGPCRSLDGHVGGVGRRL